MDESCPQCQQPLGPKSRLIREEGCGHLKCRQCLLDEEDGCSQCFVKEEDSRQELVPEPVPVEYQTVDDTKEFQATEYSPEESQDEQERPMYEVAYEIVDLEGPEGEPILEVEGEETDENLEEAGEYQEGERLKGGVMTVKTVPSHVVQIWLENEQTDKAERAFKCELCLKTFKSVHQIRYHYYCDPSIEKPFKCEHCPVTFRTGYQLKQHRQLHSNEYFECGICQKRFAHDASAKKHYKKHIEVKIETKKLQPIGEFPCDVCEKVFARKDYLKKHMICHSEEKRYECQLCQKRYMRYNALKFHIQSAHNKCEEFICPTCSKAFTSLQGLQRHMTTHSNAPRLACKICDLKSTRKDNLMRHIRSFHPDEDPKTAIIYNAEETIINTEEQTLDELNTKEIRSKEAILRKNVIVEATQYIEESSSQTESDIYMPPGDSIEATYVVLGISPEEKKERREESRRKHSRKTMEIYRKILMAEDEHDDDSQVIEDES